MLIDGNPNQYVLGVGNTFGECEVEYEFATREQAKSFASLLKTDKNVRIAGRVSLRSSRPKYRHHCNPRISVFCMAWGLGDAGAIIKLARSSEGFYRAYRRTASTWSKPGYEYEEIG